MTYSRELGFKIAGTYKTNKKNSFCCCSRMVGCLGTCNCLFVYNVTTIVNSRFIEILEFSIKID